jgi:uncharacterized Rmd1/YagE family protein
MLVHPGHETSPLRRRRGFYLATRENARCNVPYHMKCHGYSHHHTVRISRYNTGDSYRLSEVIRWTALE